MPLQVLSISDISGWCDLTIKYNKIKILTGLLLSFVVLKARGKVHLAQHQRE